MKFLCLIAFLVPLISHSSAITSGLVLPCIFGFEAPMLYRCLINSSFTITSSSAAARTISSASGTHNPGMSNINVAMLRSQGGRLNYLPLGVTTVFTSIQFVFLNDSKILQIAPSDLTQFAAVTEFLFPNNKIKDLPAGLFNATPSVTKIDFNNNNISCVAIGVFSTLNNLQNLQFSTNPCYSNQHVTRSAVTNNAAALEVLCYCEPASSSSAAGSEPSPSSSAGSSPGASTTTTDNSQCIQAEQNQTIQFNNTIASLRNELTATINAAVSGLCTAGSCSSLSTSIANLDTKLCGFITQTNNNFQNAFAALNNITLAINAIETRLRRFERSTYGRLDELQRRCCRRRGRSSSS